MEMEDFPPCTPKKKEGQLVPDRNSRKPSNGSSKPCQSSSDSEVSKHGKVAVGLLVLARKCKVRGIIPQKSDFKLQSEQFLEKLDTLLQLLTVK
jgi:hypothetical protein